MIIQRRLASSQRPSASNRPHLRKRAWKHGTEKSNAKNSILQSVAGGDARNFASIDLERVQRAIANDAAAQDQLYKMSAAKLYRSAFAVLRNREDAEDAVQDCWLRAYTNLKSFQGRSSFSTWLTRIVINSALMNLRKKRNECQPRDQDLDGIEKDSLSFQLFSSSPNPEQICAEEERKNLLNAAIANLEPRLRTAVQMGQLRERSLKETAGALGISLAAVKARLFHARVKLRKSPVLKAIVQRKSELAARGRAAARRKGLRVQESYENDELKGNVAKGSST